MELANWTEPKRFDCDSCTESHFVPRLDVWVRPGEDIVLAAEAAAEVEHFVATGCRGKVKLVATPKEPR